ncbi:hypothetical protein ACWKWC_08525 [Geodermatophilus nigrescens]
MTDDARGTARRARAAWPVWAVSVLALVALAVEADGADVAYLVIGAVCGGLGALVAVRVVGRRRRHPTAIR